MALGTPALCMTPDNTATTTTKTYTLTTTSGNAVFVCAVCENASADPNQMTISDTAGWTWTLEADYTYSTGANPRLRSQIWRAISDGNSNDVTVTGSGAAVLGWEAFQISGTNPDIVTSNNWSATNASGDPSGSFPNAIGGSNTVFVFASTAQNNNINGGAPPLTAALGTQQSYANNNGKFILAYDVTNRSQGPYTFNSTNTYTMVVGFEVAETASTSDGVLAAAGAGAASLVGQAINAGSLTAAGSGVASLVGQSTKSAALAASGVGSAAFVGAQIAAGALSASGAGSLSAVGQAIKAGALAAAGVGNAALVGSTAGATIVSGTLTAAAVGAASFVGQKIASAALVAAGVGNFVATGVQLASGALSAAGAGIASFVGQAVGVSSGTFSASGAGSAILVGTNATPPDLSMPEDPAYVLVVDGQSTIATVEHMSPIARVEAMNTTVSV